MADRTPPLNTWIVLADSARARIYRTDASLNETPEEVRSFEHPESRLKSSEITTDDGGRRAATGGQDGVRHGRTSTADGAHDHEARTFSKELAEWLDKSRHLDAFDRIVLAAPPTFLGYLRDDLHSATLDAIDVTLVKELTQVPSHGVLEAVRARIA
jgi:protein required for attachment to host cells